MNDCVGLWTEDEQCAWAAGYVMDNWRAGKHFFIICFVMWHVRHFICCCLITPAFSEELAVSMFRAVYIPLLEPLITHFYLCASILSVTSFSNSRNTEVRSDRVVKPVRKCRALQCCETVVRS
jgi:hypothetical protein